VLDQVRQVSGVGAAAGEIGDQQVSIIGSDGKPRGGNGAPSFGLSVPPAQFDPLKYVEGGPPQTDNEVVIDKASADDEGFSVGDQIQVAGKEAAKTYTLVGIATRSAAPRWRSSRCPRRSGSPARRASSTRSSSQRPPGPPQSSSPRTSRPSSRTRSRFAPASRTSRTSAMTSATSRASSRRRCSSSPASRCSSRPF
jgi:hypothetical protein